MTTNDESSSVEPATEILSRSVREKIKAIHQTNYSEDSSSSHPLSFPCIYKVSKELRRLNKRAYNPWVVSIGPIHNNNDDDKEEQHLKEMEHIKVAYTEELLCRIAGKSASPEVKGYWMDKALMECSAAMLHLAASAFNCYADNLKPIIENKIPPHRLAEMLLIDGCFILELLYRTEDLNTQGDSDQKKKITQGDPLLGNRMIMLGIGHDLLLLENQLPFFVLKELFIKTIKTIPDHPWPSCPSLTQFVRSFFGKVMNINTDDITPNLEEDKCFHILHLIHSRFLRISSNHINLEEDKRFHILHLINSCFRRIFPNNAPKPSHFSHRATDFHCAGVKFEPDTGVDFKEASGLQWWCGRAKFKIPPFSIYDSTEPLLRNLIAFEQCCPSIERRRITSYAFLMDSLIDSAADVELLEKNHIINNYLGASEDASVLFNNICQDAVLEEFDFEKPRNYAESYCRRLWPRFITSLKHDYFSNPWSVIAVVAAFILFALGVVQTVYALLTYYGVEYETVRELHDMHSVL
ncbi:UPF0481 protein [Camellia lanceoleosa]|uniref:UPF0481 protein n=1 Tax=Camellia lanceoleosa TaxID=1840588 RepID=A0ACC0GAV0_9ERIC|nr:UPF0481 protein [Camellia lanceoleosa]